MLSRSREPLSRKRSHAFSGEQDVAPRSLVPRPSRAPRGAREGLGTRLSSAGLGFAREPVVLSMVDALQTTRIVKRRDYACWSHHVCKALVCCGL